MRIHPIPAKVLFEHLNELIKIRIFTAGSIAGLVLGGVVPKSVIKESSRLPIAVALVLAGIALAVLAWPSAP